MKSILNDVTRHGRALTALLTTAYRCAPSALMRATTASMSACFVTSIFSVTKSSRPSGAGPV